MRNDSGRTTHRVHRLVAEAFIPNPNGYEEVNHIDCVRNNNHFDNLEWCTHKYNVHHSINKGNHVCTRNLFGKNNPNYGNHVLHDVYSKNPELATEKLARIGGQNGKAKPIISIDKDFNVNIFSCIKDCSEYLKSENVRISVDTIAKHARCGTQIKNYNFIFI